MCSLLANGTDAGTDEDTAKLRPNRPTHASTGNIEQCAPVVQVTVYLYSTSQVEPDWAQCRLDLLSPA